MNQREYWLEQAQCYADGQLSQPEVAALSAALREDAELRQDFLDLLSLDLAVDELATDARPIDEAALAAMALDEQALGRHALGVASPSPLMGQGSPAVSLSNGGEGSSPSAPVKSPVLGFLGGVVDYVSQSRTLMFWLIGGSLGLYFAVQLGSLMVGRFWAQNAAQLADDRGAGTEKHGQHFDQPGSGTANGAKIVARLTNAVDCRWKVVDTVGNGLRAVPRPSPMRDEGAVALDIGAEFHAGQKLNLATGLAELTFESGAKVVLTAPARFNVTDALGGDLQRGRLSAKVPHSAHGFTVGTPEGKVVDLGTEFGVKVREDGATNVIVYVGDVEVESGSGGGTGSGSNPAGADQPKVVHLHAGQAVTVGPDHIVKPIPVEDVHLVREIAPLGDPAKAEAAYVAFMKSLKPAVWFRMEGKETDRVLHDEMGGHDAKLAWDGPGNPFVKGQIGKSLWLRGTKLRDYAIQPDYPKAQNGKLSVVAWVWADSLPAYAGIALNWGEKGTGQFQFSLSDATTGKHDGGDLFVHLMQANGKIAYLGEGAGHPLPLIQWQHVAFVADGEMLHLYRQGREVASAACSGVKYPVPLKSLGIGVRLNRAGTGPSASPACLWDGKLDEIAIFNDALSADDIRKLAGAAPR